VFTLAFALQLRKKHGKTTVRVRETSVRLIKTSVRVHLQRMPQIENPFKIILLQPTRKENNRETEETMERATVTLETERTKWPNPGCL
jgi:hypothetical protein